MTKLFAEQGLGLMVACPNCQGGGMYVAQLMETDDEGKEVVHPFRIGICRDCDGKGVIPTERGKEVLEFLRRFGPDEYGRR